MYAYESSSKDPEKLHSVSCNKQRYNMKQAYRHIFLVTLYYQAKIPIGFGYMQIEFEQYLWFDDKFFYRLN